jgi:hypothetical protein
MFLYIILLLPQYVNPDNMYQYIHMYMKWSLKKWTPARILHVKTGPCPVSSGHHRVEVDGAKVVFQVLHVQENHNLNLYVWRHGPRPDLVLSIALNQWLDFLPGFESRQGVRFLGIFTLQCCCHNLILHCHCVCLRKTKHKKSGFQSVPAVINRHKSLRRVKYTFENILWAFCA